MPFDDNKIMLIQHFLGLATPGAVVSNWFDFDGTAQVFKIEGEGRQHRIVIDKSAFDRYTGSEIARMLGNKVGVSLQQPGALRVLVSDTGLAIQ